MSRELSQPDFVTARPLDATGQKLMDAAQLIRERGWCQGRFQACPDGETCIAGAMILACDGDLTFANPGRGYHECHTRVAAVVGTPSLAQWNDFFARTKDDVIRALENAAWSAP